jgi:hypothetical protein
MDSRARLLGKAVAITSISLAALVLVGCEQSQQAAADSARAASPSATTEKVFVEFEGPWAIVADPKDANSVLAFAPKTKLHNDLFVAASNDSPLAAGTYDLSVPTHGPATSGALDPSFAQVKIDAKSLQRALGDKSGRYIVRLPKPEAYVASRRFLSRVGPSYPPNAATEQNYATFVSFRYSVSSLNGFSLSGTPDTGTFNPLLLQVDTPTIRFAIEQPDALNDLCHTHSRSAFRDTVKFLGLKLYVDFPNDAADCHKTDPQITGSAKVMRPQPSHLEQVAALLSGSLVEAQTSTTVGAPVSAYLTPFVTRKLGSSVRDLTAALYFFHAADGGCKAPILFITTTP